MTTLRFDLGTYTDPGRDPDKQVNEDALIDALTPIGHAFVVCDGMGGHVGGREASTRACSGIIEALMAEAPSASPRDALKNSIRLANEAVFGLRVQEVGHGNPGSTVVALLMHRGGVEIAHVGDSRIYYVHHGQVQQITRDHSKVQLLIDIGAIRPEDARSHPETHQIFAALGISEQVDVDMKAPTVAYVEGDTFILCSDGLCDLVDAPEIRDIVLANPPQAAAAALVALANERGGHDNITVSVVRALEAAHIAPRTETVVDGAIPNLAPPLDADDATAPMNLRTQVMSSQAPPVHPPSAPRTQVMPPSSSPVLPDDTGHDPAPARKRRLDVLVIFALALAAIIGGFVVYIAMRTRHSQHHHRPPGVDSGSVIVPETTARVAPPQPTMVPVDPPDPSKNPFLEALPSATTTVPSIPTLAPATTIAPKARP